MNYISLGFFCSVAMELEKYGLRKESSPFDWTISDFRGVISAIENNFEDYVDYDSLIQSKDNRAWYKNDKYNIWFYHDFDRYKSLEKQIGRVQEKYLRRIKRFYLTISQPTLFIRYIDTESDTNGQSELEYIEENLERIMALIKSFNAENDILFIANEGVYSQKIKIYNVKKDEGDTVARNPVSDSPLLSELFESFDSPDKQANIERYKAKQEKENSTFSFYKKKYERKLKKRLLKEYIHDKVC